MTEEQVQTTWVIEAAATNLARACGEVGLSANAMRVELSRLPVDPDTLAELCFPSFFCPRSDQWLAVLALLFEAGVPFHLSMHQAADARSNGEVSYVRFYPRMDAEMLELFRSFAPGQAHRMEDLASRAERAFALLVGQRPQVP
jgi:hypothetical protein